MKKLKFIALSFLFILGSKAQIYQAGTIYPNYFDVNPDSTLDRNNYSYKKEIYNLNMFGGAGDEIKLEAFSGGGLGGGNYYIKINALKSDIYFSFGRWDSVYNSWSSYWYVSKIAKPLSAGDSINSFLAKWDSTTQYITQNSGSAGTYENVLDWVNKGDLYVGVKYSDGVSTEYGWIRLNCPSTNSCVVKDFSSTKNFASINELKDEIKAIYPNPFSSEIHLSGTKYKKNQVLDCLGREMKFLLETSSNETKINFNNEMPSGIYYLNVLTGDGSFSKALVHTSD